MTLTGTKRYPLSPPGLTPQSGSDSAGQPCSTQGGGGTASGRSQPGASSRYKTEESRERNRQAQQRFRDRQAIQAAVKQGGRQGRRAALHRALPPGRAASPAHLPHATPAPAHPLSAPPAPPARRQKGILSQQEAEVASVAAQVERLRVDNERLAQEARIKEKVRSFKEKVRSLAGGASRAGLAGRGAGHSTRKVWVGVGGGGGDQPSHPMPHPTRDPNARPGRTKRNSVCLTVPPARLHDHA